MIVSSTGTTTCLGALLGAFLAAVFGGRFFLTAGFGAPLPARRTLDFACFGFVRFAAFLRVGLALSPVKCAAGKPMPEGALIWQGFHRRLRRSPSFRIAFTAHVSTTGEIQFVQM